MTKNNNRLVSIPRTQNYQHGRPQPARYGERPVTTTLDRDAFISAVMDEPTEEPQR